MQVILLQWFNMSELQQLLQMAEDMGLQGPDIINFVREQQENSREERRLQREAEAATRAHEIVIIRLKGEIPQNQQPRTNAAKLLKLPSFNENHDKMYSFNQRFERYARAIQWIENEWATNLGALLTGKALQVYSRLSDEDAVNYQELKSNLLKRYHPTEERFRRKFRQSKPGYEETLEQYIVREKSYLEKWVEFSHTAQTYQGLRDLIVKKQIIETCPRDLSVYLQERTPGDLEEMARLGDKFLEARGRQLYQLARELNCIVK